MTAERLSELERRLRAALAAWLRLATETQPWQRFEALLHGGVHGEPPASGGRGWLLDRANEHRVPA